ncbi:MAG: phosphodiester glycosidase family protein [Thermoanaerobaculia bacterium]
MTPKPHVLLLLAILTTSSAFADWKTVAPGVDYQQFREQNFDVHVSRVDLTNDQIEVIASRESEKGTRVSDLAHMEHAVVAINGDYFDEKFSPIGMTVGPCGEWEDVKKTRREGLLVLGSQKGRITRPSETKLTDTPEEWVETAMSGWPSLIVDCDVLSPTELPGSDAFTRAPHPRTAVGLTEDRKTLFLVVADGRRTGIPGMTLAQLGEFMHERLNACSALNLDGGGSSAMWVSDRIVNRPADGVERRVGDHLAVVLKKDLVSCDDDAEAQKVAAIRLRDAQKPPAATTPTPARTGASSSSTATRPGPASTTATATATAQAASPTTTSPTTTSPTTTSKTTTSPPPPR